MKRVRHDLSVEVIREKDGRFLAVVRELPGVMAYGRQDEDAVAKVRALAVHVLADRIGHRELPLSAAEDTTLELVFHCPRR